MLQSLPRHVRSSPLNIFSEIIITNKNLEIVNSQKETAKIKTGSFDESNAFIYSTSTHVKYIFLNGKTSGTFKSLDEPLYVAFVRSLSADYCSS